jgi:hypothetical protein
MALPILDGNQSATTLSTILTGGQHIPAHTVVSLGSQAITDIANAVSSVQISGTVTASIANSVTIGSLPYTTTITGVGSQFGQGGGLAGSVVTAVPVILSSNGNIGGSLMSYDGSNTSLNVNIKGTVPAISGTVTANVAGNLNSTLEYDGSTFFVKVAGRSAGGKTDYPINISGTVTANVFGQHQTNEDQRPIPVDSWQVARADTTVDLIVPVQITNDSGTLNASNPLPISGTVTANVAGNLNGTIEAYDIDGTVSHKIAVQIYDPNGQALGGGAPLPISGTVTANIGNGAEFANTLVETIDGIGGIGVVINNTAIEIPIVAPKGPLTTRFGSVTTANTAQLTSAVTNTSRKFLLVQNIATSTVTIGIGFAPTTTQGIQLTAGAGLTFDAFCPTGGVWWLSSTTGSNFSILEG